MIKIVLEIISFLIDFFIKIFYKEVERGLCKAASGEGPEGDCPDGRLEEPGQKGTERLVIIEIHWFLFCQLRELDDW